MGIIGSIRKHSGWAVAIVGIAIVAFIIGDFTKNQRGIPEVGEIAGTTITRAHFDQLNDEIVQQYKQQSGTDQIANDVEYQIHEQVWQNLLQETLTGIELDKLGISVSKEELNDMYVGEFIHPQLRQLFTDPQTGTYNVQAIKYYTDNFENLQPEMKNQWIELEKNIKKDRSIQKYYNLVTKGFYMPNAIATKLAEYSTINSNVRVALTPFQSVPDNEVKLTDADFQKYYDEHKAEFRVREEIRSIDFVAFPITPTQKDIDAIATEVNEIWTEMQTVSDDEMSYFFTSSESENPYDSNFVKASTFPAPMDSILASASAGSLINPILAGNTWMMAKVQKVEMRPDSLRASVIWILNDKAGNGIKRNDAAAKHLADSVESLIKGGMTFDQAVAQFSDNKENNGDQGWALDGAFGFLNDGLLSHPVDGTFTIEHPQKVGYCVVKVTGKTTPNKKYRVAMLTREIVPSEATEKNIYSTANRFASENANYDEMIASAQKQNLMVRSDQVGAMSYNLGGMPNGREIIRWAFNKKTEIGDVADQVYTLNDMYVVAALKDIIEVGYAPLKQVRPMIEAQVRIEKKGELLLAKAEEAKKKSSDINALAVSLGTTVDTVADVNFANYTFGRFGMEPKVQSLVSCTKGNKLVGPIKGAQGVYMVQIDSQTKVINNDADLKAKAAGIRAQMAQEVSQKANYILPLLKDNAKIKDNRIEHF